MMRNPLLRMILAFVFVCGNIYWFISGEHIGRGRSTPTEVRFWAGVGIFLGLAVIVTTIRQISNPPKPDEDDR